MGFFSDLGLGGQKKALKMLTGHFQSVFFLISPEQTVKLVR